MLRAVKYLTGLIAVVSLVLAMPAHAASKTFSVTANSGSNSCSSSAVGSFAPVGLSVAAGDQVSVTFNVPASDSYSGGIEIRGFPAGNFVVARGGSQTTSFTAGSNFSFSGWWPSSNCHKADGSVSVAQAPPPPPPPKNSSSPPTPTSPSTTPAPQSTPTPETTPSTTNQSGSQTSSPTQSNAQPKKVSKISPVTKVVAIGLPVLIGAVFVVYLLRVYLPKRRSKID